MCRSIPLPAAAPGLPSLYLEMKPTKAVAAQPRVDATNVNLMLGIEAQTIVTTSQTKPDCPFPAALQIVPPLDKGKVNVGVPIDMPFTEVNKIISAQMKGRTFPEDSSAPVAVTVKSATVEPSGERLLISLLVNAKEKKSWFGFGADATVHVWGRPVLDQAQQTLKLADIELAVESEAAFGLLGVAARQAMPYMQTALAERATIDLKPFATEAREKISRGDGRAAQERTGRQGGCEHHRRPPRRDRLRFEDAAHRRGGRRLDQRRRDAAAEFLSIPHCGRASIAPRSVARRNPGRSERDQRIQRNSDLRIVAGGFTPWLAACRHPPARLRQRCPWTATRLRRVMAQSPSAYSARQLDRSAVLTRDFLRPKLDVARHICATIADIAAMRMIF